MKLEEYQGSEVLLRWHESGVKISHFSLSHHRLNAETSKDGRADE